MDDNDIDELKAKAAYHYKRLHECMDEIYEIDENEGQRMWEWFEEMGHDIEVVDPYHYFDVTGHFPVEDEHAD